MAKRASDGMQELIDRTGGPDVTATVTVDQIYAEVQHEALEFKHPRGGRAKYLEAPLMERHRGWIQSFANAMLKRGRNTAREWGGVGGELADSVASNAPVEFNDLRRSAALTVKEGSRIVMDVPAKQPRLTEQQLRAKSELRRGGDGFGA